LRYHLLMDIVIPYKNSASNGLELRYTLRGIEKYFPDLGNVFIIGDCPGFIQNAIPLPANDSLDRKFKALNIKNKLLLACKDKRVSDPFIMFNDDHFLLAPYQAEYFHSGPIEYSIVKFTSHQTYRQTLLNTMVALNGGKDFDTHYPIAYYKERFERTVSMVDWSKPFGYGIKSLYCNLSGIDGVQYTDVKIKKAHTLLELGKIIADKPCFSIDDRALNNSMETFLHELYPQKSLYESD
jgi:hypothetical protein